jgi:hypothetical protein
MAVATPDVGADYTALRSDLMDVLAGQCAQGRFAWMTNPIDQTRLARGIADILITACPKKDSAAFAAVLADAVILTRSILPAATPASALAANDTDTTTAQ